MARVFIIEDEFHVEWLPGEYASFAEALAEVRRLASLPWDHEKNQALCINWRSCGRLYEIVEFELTVGRPGDIPDWDEIKRTPVLEISRAGMIWKEGFSPVSV